MGESFALWNWNCVVDSRSVSRVRSASTFIAVRFFGSIFAAIAVLVFAFFSYEIFYVLRQVPASAGAPRVGQKAPIFYCWIKMENRSALAICFPDSKAVALIFYRGFW